MSEDNSVAALTAEIVSAHVANNSVPSGEVGALINAVYGALAGLGTNAATAQPARPKAAVTIRKSLASSDHIISMIDGRPYRMLRRHLGLHGYTPESYREAFELPRDYPMVAPDYAEQRRALAYKIGLGRERKGGDSAEPTPKSRRTLKPSFGDAIAAAKGHLGGE